MNPLNPQVSLLSAEEAGIEPVIKEKVPAATAPVEKTEPIVETPEAKKLKEKEEADKKLLATKTNTTPTEVSLLTEEEAEVAPIADDKSKTPSNKEIESAIDYKALVQAKIDTKAWEKWDNWDTEKDKIEITADDYLEMEQEQFDAKVEAKLQAEKEALPKRIQEITEFIKNGGKEEELYATYQQELDIEGLNPETAEDAETLVRAHCEATGWSDEKTNDYIEGLKDRGGEKLKKAGTESKAALVNVVKEEREEKLQEQARTAEQRKIYAETFNKKLRESIYKETDIPEREKKATEKFLFDYKNVDEKTGLKTSDFGVKWNEIVTDPAKYHKFVKFVQNFDKYDDSTKTESKTLNKVHNFLRERQATDLGRNSNNNNLDLQKPDSKKSNYQNLFKGKLGVV